MTPRYLGLAAVRERAAEHVSKARREWRQARTARRSGWPDIAVKHEDRAELRITVARWLARGAPAILYTTDTGEAS